MVASNKKKMGRLKLLYTCVANLTKEVSKNNTLPEGLLHYTEADDRNKVINHNHSDETSTKIVTKLKDAAGLKEFCVTDYTDSNNYQFLLSVLRELAVQKEDEGYRLRTKEDGGIDSSILQNPADPDATYREKAGKQNRGYVVNVTESTGGNSSIVTGYQSAQNNHATANFSGKGWKAWKSRRKPLQASRTVHTPARETKLPHLKRKSYL